jgi:hypothetical protein
MNAREVERELTVVLHRRAEAAMTSTNTHAEHQKLQAEVESASRNGRRRRVVGGAVAAGVAAVVGIAVWSTDLGDRADPGPAGNVQTTEEQIAQGFVEAIAAGDTDRVTAYLAPSAMDDSDWRGDLRYNEAFSREYLLEPCVENGTNSAGTWVTCPFDMHVLHSEQLGLGPYTNNSFKVLVKDGRVVSAEELKASGANSEDEIFLAIGAWVQQNYPGGKWEFMSSPGTHTPAEMQRWYQLWKVHSQQYADEMTQQADGGAGQTP